MFLSIEFPAPKQPFGFPIRRAAALLSERTLLVLGLMLFCQSGMEITLGGWSSQFVHESLGLDQGRSVVVLSFFWVGMMAARLIIVPLLMQWRLVSVLTLSWAFSATGFLFLWLAREERTAMLGLFLYGCGLAAGFPVILGVIGEIYKDVTGTAFSIAFVLALLGGSALPLITGLLGDLFDLRTSLQTVPFAGMVQILLFAVVARPGAPYRSLFLKRKDDISC
jgi:fucose permease